MDTSTATLSEVVDRRRIVELPLNGRNAASLALITAGTVLAPASADEGSSKTFPVAVTISANGSRRNQAAFRLDGANNTRGIHSAPAGLPGETSARESLRGPDLLVYESGLAKDIPLRGERMKLQFRAEFFDLFNRANFLGPGLASGDYNGTASVQHGPNVSGTGFGQITADNSNNGASSIS